MSDSRKTIDEVIFACPQFHIEKAVTARGEKFYVRPADAAAIIAMDDRNRLLITREYRPKSDTFVWRVPAGRAESGETLLTTARRELREETGYDARELIPFFSYQSLFSWIKQEKAFFIARGLFEAPLDTGDEVIQPEVHFMEPHDVLRLLNDGEIVEDIAAALYRFLHVEKLI